MRIDGALMPHQGVFAQENSTGVHISSLSDKNCSMQCHKTYVQSVCSSQSDDNIILFNRKLLQQQKQKYMQIYKWKNAKSIICDSDSDKVRDSNSNYDSHGDINNANSLLNIACNSHKNQATIQPVLTSDIQNSIPIEIKRNNLYIWRIQDKQNQIKANALSKSTIGKNRVMTAKQQDKPEQFNKIDQLCSLIYSKFTLNSETINWATFLAFIQFYWHLSFECIISSNDYNVAPIKAVMRTIQSFNIHSNVTLILCTLLLAINCCVWPHYVLADEEEHSITVNNVASTIISEFSTTTEFDYAVRGDKKFGDKCENTMECGFPGSICDAKKKSCQCIEDLPITNHIDKCGKEAAVNESCFFNEQCEAKYFQTECRDGRCTCRFEMTPIWLKDGTIECKGRQENKTPEVYVDWAMIGVLIGMALMFIIICIVLRLFSQARWHENRTIFNTPNPRLMNVSLLRESKLLHGQERRGSRMSVRGPSRQPSMTSLRPHSPNPSLGKTGSRSNSNSNNSAASLRSNSIVPGLVVNNGHHHHERRGSTYQTHTHSHQHQHHHPKSQSPPPAAHHYQSHQQHQPHHESHNQPHHHHQQQQQQPLMTNIISNPVAESVTVEILEPNNK